MRLFRPINLVIIGILQSIVQYNVIRPHMSDSVQLFAHWQFALIVMITILAGAAGYVINDIYDVQIDAHNKPGKNVIEQISTRTGWIIYAALIISGAVLTLMLGAPYRWPGIAVYIGATIILWAYSAYFKKQPLIGNAIVSVFAALVVYVVWLGQSINIPSDVDASFPYNVILMYTGFAFLTTLLREIVKDLEDLAGDRLHGARTLPTYIGVYQTRIACIIITGFLIAGIAYWLFQMADSISGIAFYYMSIVVILPLIAIIWFIAHAKGQKKWHFISQYIKAIILAGTLFLVFI